MKRVILGIWILSLISMSSGCRTLIDTVVDGFTESLFGRDNDNPYPGTDMPDRYKDRFREQKRQNDFLREH